MLLRSKLIALLGLALMAGQMTAQKFELMWTAPQIKSSPLIYSYDGGIIAAQTTDTTVVLLDSLNGIVSDTLSIPRLEGNFKKGWEGAKISLYGRSLLAVTLEVTPDPNDVEEYFHIHQLDPETSELSKPLFTVRAHPNSEYASTGYSYSFSGIPSASYMIIKVYTHTTSENWTYEGGNTTFYDVAADVAYEVENKPNEIGVSGDGETFTISSSFHGSNASGTRSVDQWNTWRFSSGKQLLLLQKDPTYVSTRITGNTVPLGKSGSLAFQDTINGYPRPSAPWRVKAFSNESPGGDLGDGVALDSSINIIAAYEGSRIVVAVDRTDIGNRKCEIILYDIATESRISVIDTIDYELQNDLTAYAHPAKNVLFVSSDTWLRRYTAPSMSSTDTAWISVSSDSVRIFETVEIQPRVFLDHPYSKIILRWGDSSLTVRRADSSWRLTSETEQSHKLTMEISETTTGWSQLIDGPVVTFGQPQGTVLNTRLSNDGIISINAAGRYLSTIVCTRFQGWRSLKGRLDTVFIDRDTIRIVNILEGNNGVYEIRDDSCIVTNVRGYGKEPDPFGTRGNGSRFRVERAMIGDTTGDLLWLDSIDNYYDRNAAYGVPQEKLYERACTFSYNTEIDVFVAVMDNVAHLIKGYSLEPFYNKILMDRPCSDTAFLALIHHSSPDSLRQERLLDSQVYSVDASFGGTIVAARGNAVYTYDLSTSESSNLVDQWTGTPLYDAIRIDSTVLVTNAGIFHRTSDWSIKHEWPFNDGRAIGRVSANLTYVLRSNRDSVGCIINHYSGEIVQWLGQSVCPPRAAAYDPVLRLIYVGDSCGIISVYDVNEIVSVGERVYKAEIGIRVVPSITTGSIEIQADLPLDEIHIYTMTGQVVRSFDLTSQSTTHTVDVSELASGMYLIRARTGEHWSTGMMVNR